MSAGRGFKIEIIKKGHRNDWGDQEKYGEFTKDGGILKGGHEDNFFIADFHRVTLISIPSFEKKNFIFL